MKNMENPTKDRTGCPEGVSVLCWHASPIAKVPWKPVSFGDLVKIDKNVKFGGNLIEERLSLSAIVLKNII